MKLAGGYYVLAALPLWATAASVFMVTIGIKWLFQWKLHGFWWDTSASSHFGDQFLLWPVLIGATILHRHEMNEPLWFLASWPTHIMLLIGCVGVGAIVCRLTIAGRSGGLVDMYHDLVVVPALLYLAITLVPLIYLEGTTNEKWWALAFVCGWALLVVYDFHTHRINQKQWLQDHLETFIHVLSK